jgi:Flp pilus assembly protein TadG
MKAPNWMRAAGRRGNVAILTAFVLPAMVGFTALSVDLSVVAVGRAQLQTASDSAALAGAVSLASQQRLLGYPLQSADLSSAQNQAIQFAASNKVLGQGALVQSNPYNSNTGTEDLVVGYLPRPLDPTQAFLTGSTWLPYYNAVQVRTSRTPSHGGALPNFFSAIWGNRGSSVSVSSTAAVLGVSGFQAIDSYTSANLLPIVLDKNTFYSMIRSQTTDQYTYNSATNTVTARADGITESKLYPVANGYPGNWGTINVGVTNNSTSTLSAQIQYGITPAQLATYPGGVIQPDPTTGTIQFSGNPGISAGIKDALTSIIGKPVRIPIFDPSQTGGNGNNLVYTVIAFAPVRILAVSFQGKNKYVIVQPATVTDPTEVWGGIIGGPMTGQYRVLLIR